MGLAPEFSSVVAPMPLVACFILLLIIARFSRRTYVIVERLDKAGPDPVHAACELVAKMYPPLTIFMTNGTVVKLPPFSNAHITGQDSLAIRAPPTSAKQANLMISQILGGQGGDIP